MDTPIAPYRLPLDPNDAQRCICPLCQSLSANAPMPTFAGPILQCDECGEHYFADAPIGGAQ
jgi:hypothetical protein